MLKSLLYLYLLVFFGIFQNSFSKGNDSSFDRKEISSDTFLDELDFPGESTGISEGLIENPISRADTVKIGMFINSIHDLNFEETSFKIDFWMWCVFKNKELPIKEWIEFPNTKSFEFSNHVQDDQEHVQWLTMRGSGEVLKEWDARRFPFDTYNLTITLGLSTPLEDVVFVADTVGSMIDPDFELMDWIIIDKDFSNEVKRYTTSFGDPTIILPKIETKG